MKQRRCSGAAVSWHVDEENQPLPKFLRKHRNLHSFDPT
jgi:hypothetical protein